MKKNKLKVEREIPVFSAGKVVGTIKVNELYAGPTLLEVPLTVKVMVMSDMEYGLLVPLEIVDKIEAMAKTKEADQSEKKEEGSPEENI